MATNEDFQCVIPLKPIAERKRSWHGGTVRVDLPDRKKYKRSIAGIAKAAMGSRQLFEGPILVMLTFERVKPPSWPKRPTKANTWPSWPWKKPDLSNFVKICEDALTGIVWVDDAQICQLIATKKWAETAQIDVRVETLPQVDGMLEGANRRG